MSFKVDVDPTNPGQFFACCGLLELAHRMTGAATGRFERQSFVVDAPCELSALLDRLTGAPLVRVHAEDDRSSPLRLGEPFGMLVDWWQDEEAGGSELKVWAGSMQNARIARAMIAALQGPAFHAPSLLDVGCVVHDPRDPNKKVEPFYFDARRGPNAHSRDIGFSPNDLGLETTAFPAVEALCLMGLQRCRPEASDQRRIFQYRTWSRPLSACVVAPVVSGAVRLDGTRRYRFETAFRSGYMKAFRQGVSIDEGKDHG